MNFKEEDNDHSKEKIEKNDEKPVHLSEEQIAKTIEHATKKTADVCLKHFEKFHREEMEFQRKVQKEEAEYQRKIQLEDRDFERAKRDEDNERNRRHLKSDMWWKVFATVLAAAGLYLFFFGSIATDKANSQRAYNQHQIDIIREDITEKKRMLQAGTEAISILRTADQKIIRHCQYGHPYSQEEQQEMKWDGEQKIADAFANVAYVFNDSVLNKVREIIKFSASIPDVCTYNSNELDNRLLKYKTEIFNEAQKSLGEDKKKIERLK